MVALVLADELLDSFGGDTMGDLRAAVSAAAAPNGATAAMTQLAVLLGHGIGYSASPAMHNAAFAALELDARYELRDVDGTTLPARWTRCATSDSIGANVTQPHKIEVCELVDELAPEPFTAWAR